MAALPPPKISGQARPWLVRTVPRRHGRRDTPGRTRRGTDPARKRLRPGAAQNVQRKGSSCSKPRVEIADLSLGFVAGNAIALLEFARQIFRTAGCGLQIVVGELAPAGFEGAAELFPLALDRVLVH